MTAIKANASSVPPVGKEENAAQRPKLSPPSSSEDEAKSRFVSALSSGVHSLIARGHGRARASAALLNEISDGCSPDEDEVGIMFLIFGGGCGFGRDNKAGQ